MFVKITANTVIKGIGAVLAGEVYELDGKRARELFVVGRAVECDPPKPEPEPAKKPTTRKPKTTTRKK